jgi:hypothetical protein
MLQRLHFTRSKTGRIRIEDQFGNRCTIIDEVDHVYTRLTVLRFVGITDTHKAIFLCACECGNRSEVTGNDLRSGTSKSCGCYNRDCTRQRNHERREMKHDRFRDLTGMKQKHGRLTAIRCVGFRAKTRHAKWECQCSCGKVVIVSRGGFLDETSASCGCLKHEVCKRQVGRANPNFKHGRYVKAA